MSLLKGLFSASAFSANTNWGGDSILSGVVSVNNIPAHRLVRLYEASSGNFISECWSRTDGKYAFSGLNNKYRYQIVASDTPNFAYADKAALQTPGVWALDIDLVSPSGNLAIEIGTDVYSGRSGEFHADLLRASAMFANAYYGGQGMITGRVLLSGIPVSRRVRLYEQSTGLPIAAMQADTMGRFAFSGIDAGRRYAVMVSDFPAYADADAIACNLATVLGRTNWFAVNRIGLSGLFKADRPHLQPNYGGSGTVSGTVKINAAAGSAVPCKRRVRLYEHSTGILIRECWSGADGQYRFEGVNKACRYTVTATDYPEYTYNDTIACNITPV